jgi:hypothetical protein
MKIAFGTATLLNSIFESSNDSQALLQLFQSIDAEELNMVAGEILCDSRYVFISLSV